MAPTILVLPGTHISRREVLGTTGMVVSIDHSSRLCVGQSCAQSMLVRAACAMRGPSLLLDALINACSHCQ